MQSAHGMSGAALANLRHSLGHKIYSRDKMRKKAIKLGRELIPSVKISDNDNFKGKTSMPYE